MKKNNVFPRIPGLCALFFLLIWNRTAISQVDVKMRSIVKQLRSSAIKNNIDVGHMTLAVFPFQTDAALMKKRVHIACGELLTLNILEDGRTDRRDLRLRLLTNAAPQRLSRSA